MVDPVIIGDATLFCGDCLEIDVGAVDHVISDPPYEASLHAAKSHLSNLRKDSGPELKEIDFTSIDAIRSNVVSKFGAICDGWFIVFCTVEGVAPWANLINESALKYKRACVWIKPDSTPQLNGQGPAQGAENFVCAWAGQGHAKWNAGGKRGVYTHCVNGQERHGEHPTEKPRRLMAEIIADFTNQGQTICDPFAGSGTTGVAAVQMGRKFIGIEKNPRYFDIMCERIEQANRQDDLFIERTKQPKPAQFDLEAP